MYELILVLLFSAIIFSTFSLSCKLISHNSINSTLVKLKHYLPTEKQHSLIKYILLGLKDTESGLFARLNARSSSPFEVKRKKIQTQLLCSKISQSLIITSFFLPSALFPLFIAAILISSLYYEKKISTQTFGAVLGLGLIKICLAEGMLLMDLFQELSAESFPGGLYIEFSKNHSWMFALNCLPLPFLTLNFAIIFPPLFVLCTLLQLTLLQLFFCTLGIFAGYAVRYYAQARVLRGIVCEGTKLNALFYVICLVWTLVIFFSCYFLNRHFLDNIITQPMLWKLSFLFLGLILLSILLHLALTTRMPNTLMAAFPAAYSKSKIQKYTNNLFKETLLGMKILINEMRVYSREQAVFVDLAIRWEKENDLDMNKIKMIHHNFTSHFNEIKEYLGILFRSEEARKYENQLMTCATFLDRANALENNLFERFTLLRQLIDTEDSNRTSPLFSFIAESGKDVYDAYIPLLETLEKESKIHLSKIIEEKTAEIQAFQENKGAFGHSLEAVDEANHKKIAQELLQLFQVDLWQLNQQAEILENWNRFESETSDELEEAPAGI